MKWMKESQSFTYSPVLQCISCIQHQSTKASRKPAKQCSHGVLHTHAHTHNHSVHTQVFFPIPHAFSFPLHPVFLFLCVHLPWSSIMLAKNSKSYITDPFLSPSISSDWPSHKALQQDNCGHRKEDFPFHCMLKMWSLYSNQGLIQPQNSRYTMNSVSRITRKDTKKPCYKYRAATSGSAGCMTTQLKDKWPQCKLSQITLGSNSMMTHFDEKSNS